MTPMSKSTKSVKCCVFYKHFVRFYAVKTSFSYPKYLTACLLSSLHNVISTYFLAGHCLVPSDGKLQENEGVFLDAIETKIFCPYAIHSHLHQQILLLPMVGLEISIHQQLKVGGGLALFTLYLCLPLKVALFFYLITLYL